MFFRHCNIMFFMKEKVTNTICNKNFSDPLIYKLLMPSHIWNDILLSFPCSTDIIVMFASHTV